MLMYPYRLSVTGLNVGYSACLGFTVIYATNTVKGETDCVIMSVFIVIGLVSVTPYGPAAN